MTILEQIGVGLLTDGIGAIIGLVGFAILRKRLFDMIKHEIATFINEFMQIVAQNPEILRPMLDSVMKSVISRPGGIVPKEATVKLPFLGKVPASWFEPLVKQGIGKMLKVAGEEAKESAETGVFG